MTVVTPLVQPDSRRQHQLELEKLYNKNQTLTRIKREFQTCTDVDFSAFMMQEGIPQSFGFDLMTQLVLHKRTTLGTMVAILRHHFEPAPDANQQTADMILKAAMVDLVDWDPNLRQLVVRFNISQDVQDDLDRFQYPLPMVVRPREIQTNTETGYLMSSGSVILRKNHHEDDVCLDHLNRMNKVKFAIDMDTATMIKNQWKHLDKPKSGETQEEFDRRKRAFDKYDRSAKDVMTLLLQEGNEFYLTHKYDKRGRIYCQGYHVNYQGAAWNKAVIQLADKELVE